jgi:4-amino-4-deoxy-L-arabinose transferase-like glycosyltransferase
VTTLAGPRAAGRSAALAWPAALAGLLLGALALRLWAFGGVSFALNADDGRYVAVAQNLAHGHAPSGAAEWFGGRVLLLFPVAGLFRLLGASDYTAVAWPIAGSLLGVGGAYLLGRDLASRRVGLIAAGLVAVAPLEVLMATRLRPDALMPALVALAVWAAVRAGRAARPAGWAAAAGALLGCAWSVRESALVLAPVLVLAAWGAGRRALLPALAGLVAVALAAMGAMVAVGGRALAPLTGAAGAGEWHDPLSRWSWAGSYLALALRDTLRPHTLLFLALPALAAAVAALAVRRERRALLPCVWLAWTALYLEVGTLPDLAKPERFLTLCTIPAALVVALALGGVRVGALAVAGLAAVSVLALAPLPAREHRATDVVLLNRVVSAMRDLPRRPILAESYVWWAKLGAYLPTGRLSVERAEDPAFLSPSARRARRRLRPLPDPLAYRGGYVVRAPVDPRAGWPTNWSAFRTRFRREVPWSRLVPVVRVGPATVYRWPASAR